MLIANLGEPPPSDSVGPLSQIGAVAVPALTSALKSSNLYVRQNAAEALAGIKPVPPDAIQALTAALKDPNSTSAAARQPPSSRLAVKRKGQP
jgi:HEAT repeat protein